MYKWDKPNRTRDKYKHAHHEYDPKTPTFSSSLLDRINKSHKTHSKTEQEDELCFLRSTKNRGRGGAFSEEKMSSLRRACMVEKWMEKKVSEKIISSTRNTKSSSSSSTKRTTLLDEFDVQDTLFFSTTSETEYSVFFHSRSNAKTLPFKTPPIPKPVRTRSKYLDPLDDHAGAIESRYLEQLTQNKDEVFVKTRSRAQKIYSNLKSLKQPISPGVRLSSFISSLFVKEGKREKTSRKECKSEQASTCSSASSLSRSCLSKNSSPRKKFQDGIKRTVRFCPVSVIINDDDYEDGRDRMSSKVARSISKRFEELRELNGLESRTSRLQKQKQLEEVALDLLNGYWDAELSKSQSQKGNDKVNDGDYGDNHGENYDQEEENDGFSCSSSDLFELDHLSLIGDELPVYETTRFDPKVL